MISTLLFSFSQGSLQDFLECRRRFFLRYIKKVKWPAVQTEPVLESEKHLRQGAAFHRSIHQYLLRIPSNGMSFDPHNEEYQVWWQNFINFATQLDGVSDPTARRFPEQSLVGTIAGQRLVAKYDLITIFPNNKVIIYDWKTSLHRSDRKWLANRMQTIIYPYLIQQSGMDLTLLQEIDPNDITLVYWFASFPEQIEIFKYGEKEFKRDQKFLADLLKLINRLVETEDEHNFPLTENEKHCAFCVYRSLCDRGIKAGLKSEVNEPEIADQEIVIDFDQITELSL